MLHAQTGDADVSVEVNMKAPVSTTEHVHSTPQPEKVRIQGPITDNIICIGVLGVHYPPVNSYISELWRTTKRGFMFLPQLSLSPHVWLSIWQQKAADIVGHVANRQPETLIQPKLLLLVSVIFLQGLYEATGCLEENFFYHSVDSIWNEQWCFPTCLHA